MQSFFENPRNLYEKAMNEVYAEEFKAVYPARCAFAVKELPKKALVEIEVIAAI